MSSPAQKKSIELAVLMPYLDKVQASGALSLSDAWLLTHALSCLSTASPTHATSKRVLAAGSEVPPEERASNIIVTSLIKGQGKGAFSLVEASHIAEMLHLVDVPPSP